LEAGNKAFTEESGATIDRMIRDQFMVRNDDKTRLHLIEKSPQTAREALSLAISFQAAHSFNDTMKDAAVTIASTEVNNGENRENRANRPTGNRTQERNIDNRNFRFSFNDERQSRNRTGNYGQNRSRENSRDRSWERSSRQDIRERYFSGPRERDGGNRDRSRERYRPSSRDRYDSDNRDRTHYSPNPRNRLDDRERSRERNWDRYSPRSTSDYKSYINNRYVTLRYELSLTCTSKYKVHITQSKYTMQIKQNKYVD
jgi:hypothetical protein